MGKIGLESIQKKRKNKTGEKDKRISFEYIIKCILTVFFYFLYNIFHSYYYSYVSTINLTIKCSFSIVSIVSEQLNLRGKNYWIATVIRNDLLLLYLLYLNYFKEEKWAYKHLNFFEILFKNVQTFFWKL